MAQATPVVLGANVGTTVSSQAFVLAIDEFGPVAMLATFLGKTLLKGDGEQAWCRVLFGIGLVLFGRHTIGEAAEGSAADNRLAEDHGDADLRYSRRRAVTKPVSR